MLYVGLLFRGRLTRLLTARGRNIALFNYQNNRAGACAANYQGDFSGYLKTGGYQAYDTLKTIEHLRCMVHARRKFMDAKKVLGKV